MQAYFYRYIFLSFSDDESYKTAIAGTLKTALLEKINPYWHWMLQYIECCAEGLYAVSLLLMHWRYCSLALSHRFDSTCVCQHWFRLRLLCRGRSLPIQPRDSAVWKFCCVAQLCYAHQTVLPLTSSDVCNTRSGIGHSHIKHGNCWCQSMWLWKYIFIWKWSISITRNMTINQHCRYWWPGADYLGYFT